jgi:hypothetical protein
MGKSSSDKTNDLVDRFRPMLLRSSSLNFPGRSARTQDAYRGNSASNIRPDDGSRVFRRRNFAAPLAHGFDVVSA